MERAVPVLARTGITVIPVRRSVPARDGGASAVAAPPAGPSGAGPGGSGAAVPTLTEESARTQGVDVTMPGATATSDAYRKSLQVSIDTKGN
ncbi:hypothetical protein [Streptomyces sp. NPDC090025]|uniref:hypothetical protein n=1 Tax=Streptomyces sp. NPDC090025 TaxID=3365922 RepID=UPI003837D54E